METANKVKIHVCGTEYTITSSEDPNYVRRLGVQIDEQSKELMENDESMSLTAALTLCAMSYLDDANKAYANSDHLRTQIKDYLEEAAKSRIEVDEAKREIEKLRHKVAALTREQGEENS